MGWAQGAYKRLGRLNRTRLKHRPYRAARAQGFAAAWDAALERGVQRLVDCALERTLKGTPTPIISAGKPFRVWNKPDNNLLKFLLQHRMRERYSPASTSKGVGRQRLKPCDPEYEAIRGEVLAEEHAERPSFANSHEAREAQCRARAIELYGHDPMEEDETEEDGSGAPSRWSCVSPDWP